MIVPSLVTKKVCKVGWEVNVPRPCPNSRRSVRLKRNDRFSVFRTIHRDSQFVLRHDTRLIKHGTRIEVGLRTVDHVRHGLIRSTRCGKPYHRHGPHRENFMLILFI